MSEPTAVAVLVHGASGDPAEALNSLLRNAGGAAHCRWAADARDVADTLGQHVRRRRNGHQQFGRELPEGLGDLAGVGRPAAMCGHAGVAQQAVECLGRLGRGAVHEHGYGCGLTQSMLRKT